MKLKVSLLAVMGFCLIGSGGARTAYAAPTDACALLTPAQVSAALGFSAKPGHPGLSDAKTCVWPLANFTKIGSKDTKLVQVTIMDSQDWATVAPLVGVLGTVKGAGDSAVYGPGNSTLYVKRGKIEFSVFMQGFPDDLIKAKERTLALDVLAKL